MFFIFILGHLRTYVPIVTPFIPKQVSRGAHYDDSIEFLSEFYIDAEVLD